MIIYDYIWLLVSGNFANLASWTCREVQDLFLHDNLAPLRFIGTVEASCRLASDCDRTSWNVQVLQISPEWNTLATISTCNLWSKIERCHPKLISAPSTQTSSDFCVCSHFSNFQLGFGLRQTHQRISRYKTIQKPSKNNSPRSGHDMAECKFGRTTILKDVHQQVLLWISLAIGQCGDHALTSDKRWWVDSAETLISTYPTYP